MFDRIRSLARSLVARPRAEDVGMSDVPPDFLVVGLQKSGTYWVTALLDAHPRITAIPPRPGGRAGVTEGHFFDTLALREERPDRFEAVFREKHDGLFRDLIDSRADHTDAALESALFRRYNAWVQSHRSAPNDLVGEKTTEYALCLDLIDRFLPDIPKICILRDPRDRVVSWHFQLRRKGRRTSSTVDDPLLKDYARRVNAEAEQLARHADSVHFMSYERLHDSAEAEASGVLAFLGVNHDVETCRAMVRAASFERLTGGRAKGEDDASSHFRSGVVGDWRRHMTPSQEVTYMDAVAPALERLADAGVDVSRYGVEHG